jgi:hypothetical protein
VGATLSTAIAGDLAGRFGTGVGFLALTVAGVAAVLSALAVMPETRPADRGAAGFMPEARPLPGE